MASVEEGRSYPPRPGAPPSTAAHSTGRRRQHRRATPAALCPDTRSTPPRDAALRRVSSLIYNSKGGAATTRTASMCHQPRLARRARRADAKQRIKRYEGSHRARWRGRAGRGGARLPSASPRPEPRSVHSLRGRFSLLGAAARPARDPGVARRGGLILISRGRSAGRAPPRLNFSSQRALISLRPASRVGPVSEARVASAASAAGAGGPSRHQCPAPPRPVFPRFISPPGDALCR